MTYTDLRNRIEQQAQTNLRIGDELASVVEFLIVNGHTPGNSRIKTPEYTNQCQEASYHRIERLVHEMGMVQKYNQGPSTYLIHTRLDKIVNGQNVSQMVNDELDRVAQHASKSSAVRQIVANARGVPTGQALNRLKHGNFANRRERLERIVDAIAASSAVSQGPYGKIMFRTPANLYNATPLAVQLYRK